MLLWCKRSSCTYKHIQVFVTMCFFRLKSVFPHDIIIQTSYALRIWTQCSIDPAVHFHFKWPSIIIFVTFDLMIAKTVRTLCQILHFIYHKVNLKVTALWTFTNLPKYYGTQIRPSLITSSKKETLIRSLKVFRFFNNRVLYVTYVTKNASNKKT